MLLALLSSQGHEVLSSLHREVASLAGPRGHAAAPKLDVDAVVNRVRHALVADPVHAGVLTAADDTYRATFDHSGFSVRSAAGTASALGVALVQAGRGRHIEATSNDPWSGHGNVASRPVGNDMVERVTASNGTVEWDVVLARRPAGEGALAIDATLRGLRGAPERIMRQGRPAWQFTLAGGSHAVMGEVVVRDATGAVVHRALPTVTGDRVRIEVPDRVLQTAKYPVVVDPSVGPEVGAGAYQAAGTQVSSGMAWNGSEFLVAWYDGPTGDVVASRVSGAGAVLDPAGIPLGSSGSNFVESPPFRHGVPSVAWNGAHFLVVWTQGNGIFGDGSSAVGVRVDAAGIVADGTPIVFGGGSYAFGTFDGTFTPSVAAAGATFVVAFVSITAVMVPPPLRPASEIRFSRVSDAGANLNPGGIGLSGLDDSNYNGSPSTTALSASNVLVVWSHGASILAARVNGTSGSVLEPAFVVSSQTVSVEVPVAASNGTDFLVAWTKSNGADLDVTATRVSSTGTVLNPTGITVSAASGNQFDPAITATGSGYLVAWDDQRNGNDDVYAARLDSSGTVLDPSGRAVTTDGANETQPSVAWNGTNALVAYNAPTGNIEGVRLDASAAVIAPTPLLLSTQNASATESDPVLAWNGTNYLVVWVDARNGASDIFGALVDGSGRLLQQDAIAISLAAGAQTSPSVAWNGSAFLVAWDDARNGGHDIYGTRVTAAGGVSSPVGVAYSTATSDQLGPVVAANGATFLVVWEDFRAGEFLDNELYGTRVNSAGTVLDAAGINVSGAVPLRPENPAIASDGTNWLVAWTDARNVFTGSQGHDIYAARVSSTGTVLDAGGKPISTAAHDQNTPAVAWNGTNYLVAWTDVRSNVDGDIYGTRVNPSGVALSPAGTAISTAPGNQSLPVVAFDGSWLVAWADQRNSRSDIYASRVDANGATSDSAGIPVENTTFDSGKPALAGGPNGTWETAYARNVSAGAATVFARSIAPK